MIYLVGTLCLVCNSALRRCGSPIVHRSKKLSLHIKEVESASQAFIGGTAGVISVALILELRKISDRILEGCPYCMGNGEILCGCCLGAGKVNASACMRCVGRGLITCINCKGDGRETPIMLLSKAARNPVRTTLYSNLRVCTPMANLHNHCYRSVEKLSFKFICRNMPRMASALTVHKSIWNTTYRRSLQIHTE